MNKNRFTQFVSFVLVFICLTSSALAQNNSVDYNEYYLPRQISKLSIKQNVLYSSKKKMLYRQNEAVALVLPGEFHPDGLDRRLGIFKYEELKTVLENDSRAIWVNPYNPTMQFTTTQALENNWYDCQIQYYKNPINNQQIDIEKYDEALTEKAWEEFNILYKNQGDLLSSVRSWQKLDSTSIVMKPKKIKIPKKGIATLTSIWFDVDFKDKANMSFNGEKRELSRIIIDAVLAGKLTPYKTFEFEDKMTIDEFKERMTYPNSEE